MRSTILATALAISACGSADGKDGSSCSVRDTGAGMHTVTCGDGTSAVLRDGQDGQDGQNAGLVPEHAWFCPAVIPAFTLAKSFGTVTYDSMGMVVYGYGPVYFATCQGAMITVPTVGGIDSDTEAYSDWYPGTATTLECFAEYLHFTFTVASSTLSVVPVGESVSPVVRSCTKSF